MRLLLFAAECCSGGHARSLNSRWFSSVRYARSLRSRWFSSVSYARSLRSRWFSSVSYARSLRSCWFSSVTYARSLRSRWFSSKLRILSVPYVEETDGPIYVEPTDGPIYSEHTDPIYPEPTDGTKVTDGGLYPEPTDEAETTTAEPTTTTEEPTTTTEEPTTTTEEPTTTTEEPTTTTEEPTTTTEEPTTTTTTTTTTTRPTAPPTPKPCTKRTKADIILLLDASTSIGKTNWANQVKFAAGVTENFNVGKDDVRFGTVIFNRNATKIFDLNKYFDHESLSKALLGIKYPNNQGTYTHLGLQFITDDKMFSTASGGRDDANNILMVMTDGQSVKPKETAKAAEALKAQGTTVIAVGIGPDPSKTELNAIASKPEYVFLSEGYSMLEYIKRDLVSLTCETID
ncbi:uncharacterized protein LOC131945272 [Physella acuta]|uniref:uncharacterized protein LOC131945272 n=1 Tax=Physella acuta TaxID=109671 RepID=UPI0027DAF006|nr:uncharacterized protein LOC131945272 [Physella acuta]